MTAAEWDAYAAASVEHRPTVIGGITYLLPNDEERTHEITDLAWLTQLRERSGHTV